MDLHDHLSVLTLQAGSGVLDDANALRSGLAPYVAANPGATGDVELVVAVAGLGATRSLVATIDAGTPAASAVADLGARLAPQLGAPAGYVQWACAALGYAAGRVSDADVRRFRGGDQPTVPPPVAAPMTPPGPSFSPPTVGPGYQQQPAFQQPYGAQPSSPPGYPQPTPPAKTSSTGLVVAGAAVAVVLIAGGVFLAINAGGDDTENAADDPTSSVIDSPSSPTDSATSETTSEPPSTEPTTEAPLVSQASSAAYIKALNDFSPKFSAAGDLITDGRINHEFDKTLQGASQMRDAVYEFDADVRLIDLSGIQESVDVLLESDREMIRLLDQIQNTTNSRKVTRKVGELPIKDFTGSFQDVAVEIDDNVG